MKLTRLKVEGLFNLFDYDIPLDNEEGLVIITGPNGYGKTMLLNIIYNFIKEDRQFFDRLDFSKIDLFFNTNVQVKISKVPAYGMVFKIFENGEDVFEGSSQSTGYSTNSSGTSQVVDHDKVIFFEGLNVYLIREQRLVKVSNKETAYSLGSSSSAEIAIKEVSPRIIAEIDAATNTYGRIAQELDSSFPKKLLREVGKFNEIELITRFKTLKEKQERLVKYNIFKNELEIPTYTTEDAKVLSVYLKDTEDKLAVFDELLLKLEIFTNILNNRNFAFKSIKIDRSAGVFFETDGGKKLNLGDLSSGEQHEVVLLFELIFRATPNTLVLIDEPELSLHVTWQREFLNDLLRIMSFQKMQVIIATHSPQIINDRWDLVYNLEKVPA